MAGRRKRRKSAKGLAAHIEGRKKVRKASRKGRKGGKRSRKA